jgi:hypothetical protein
MQASSGQPACGPNTNPDARVINTFSDLAHGAEFRLSTAGSDHRKTAGPVPAYDSHRIVSMGLCQNPQGERRAEGQRDRGGVSARFEAGGANPRISKPIGDDVQSQQSPDAGCFASCLGGEFSIAGRTWGLSCWFIVAVGPCSFSLLCMSVCNAMQAAITGRAIQSGTSQDGIGRSVSSISRAFPSRGPILCVQKVGLLSPKLSRQR